MGMEQISFTNCRTIWQMVPDRFTNLPRRAKKSQADLLDF